MVNATLRPFFTPGKDPVPIVYDAGWTPGPVWTGAENLALKVIRSPDRPARSKSLYRHILKKTQILYFLRYAFCGIFFTIFLQYSNAECKKWRPSFFFCKNEGKEITVTGPEVCSNVVRLSAVGTGRLYPSKYSWYSFMLKSESTPDS